jgi:hypothetical protein
MMGPSLRNPGAYDDDFEDQPGQGWFYQYGLGVALPMAIMYYGIAAVVMRRAWTGDGHGGTTEWHGWTALGIGWAAISLGVFLHCHYFWGNVYNQAWFAVLGKIISACGFIAGLVVFIVRWGMGGRV